MDTYTHKIVAEHFACARDQQLSWEARQWHAGMYQKITGNRLHVYVNNGVVHGGGHSVTSFVSAGWR